MLERVPRCRQRAQGQAAEVKLIRIGQRGVRKFPATVAGDDLRAVDGCELAGARQEVGVQVRLGDVADPQSVTVRGFAYRAQVTARVHYQRSSIAEIDEVGTVAQPLVDKRKDSRATHPRTGAWAATRGISQAILRT